MPSKVNSQPLEVLQRLERAIRNLQAGCIPSAVHQFRTSARRAEAALMLAPESRDASKLLPLVKRWRRRAGKLRSCDVRLGLLQELHLGPELHAQLELRRGLEERRTRQQRRLENKLNGEPGRELRRRLQRLRHSWRQSPPSLPDAASGPALQQFLYRWKTLPGWNDAGMHELRKRAKQLRYLAELDSTPLARAMDAPLRKLQTAIGGWHDWAELSAWASLRPGAAGAAHALENVAGGKQPAAVRGAEAALEQLRLLPAQARRPPASVPNRRTSRALSA